MWRHSPVAAHLLALLGYAFATVVFTWPLVLDLSTAIPGDSFDGWQNYWNLWWIKVALVERVTNPLFSELLYHPTGVSLYFHTLNPFNGLATLPIQLAAGLIPAYNAVVFLSWVLAGYGVFLLAGRVASGEGRVARGEGARGGRRGAIWLGAFGAGLIYTLSPFHMAHLLGHMQVMSLQWIPFYALYLLRAQEQSRGGNEWLRSALMAGLFLTLVGLCDWYFVLYLLLFAGLAVVWETVGSAWLTRRGGGTGGSQAALFLYFSWRAVAPPLVAGMVFAALLSPWLIPMIWEATRFRFMVRPPADLYILSASALDFVIPNRLHTLFRPGSFEWPGNQIAPVSERTVAVGYMALVLALPTLWKLRRQAAFWWIVAIFFFMLALGPQWHFGNITFEDVAPAAVQGGDLESWTPYGLLVRVIPFMRISRSVSRFALMVQLSVAVLAGLGLAKMLAGRGSAVARYAIVVACVIGVLSEYWVAPYPLSPPDTPAFYAQLAEDTDPRAVLNLPMNYDRPGYLLYQTVHNKPLTVAYISRDDPRTLTERVPVLQHFRHLGEDILDVDPARVGLTVLQDLGVGTVVLDRYKMPGGEERRYTEQLAGAIFGGEKPIFEDERVSVYRVPPVTVAEPYMRLGAANWGPLEEGKRRRVLTGGPAAIEFAHVPAARQLAIRYRSEAGSGFSAVAGDGSTSLGDFPPAMEGAEIVLDLGSPAPERIELIPDVAGGVQVERIALQ